MTDAASENLKIEGMIATSLQYNHEPVHLEKLDASNLNALSEVKNSVNQRQTLETKSPSLKSFFFSWEKYNSRCKEAYISVPEMQIC